MTKLLLIVALVAVLTTLAGLKYYFHSFDAKVQGCQEKFYEYSELANPSKLQSVLFLAYAPDITEMAEDDCTCLPLFCERNGWFKDDKVNGVTGWVLELVFDSASTRQQFMLTCNQLKLEQSQNNLPTYRTMIIGVVAVQIPVMLLLVLKAVRFTYATCVPRRTDTLKIQGHLTTESAPREFSPKIPLHASNN